MNELWPPGVATFALKSDGHVERQAGHSSNLDWRGICGALRASDLEPGTGRGGSVRPALFGRGVF